MYRTLFPRDVFQELDRLQQDMQQALGLTPSIRGATASGFPALNVGSTPKSVEIYAFAPGLDPASIEVQLDRSLLSLAAERKADLPADGGQGGAQAVVHINERYAGRFRRVVSLPEDIDPQQVTADYRDGVLRVSVARLAAPQPRRIEVH